MCAVGVFAVLSAPSLVGSRVNAGSQVAGVLGHGGHNGGSAWVGNTADGAASLRQELRRQLLRWVSKGDVSPAEASLLACSWGLHAPHGGDRLAAVDKTHKRGGEGAEPRARPSPAGAAHATAGHDDVGVQAPLPAAASRTLRVVPYHVVFGAAAHDGYHEDGAERLARGYNEAHPVRDEAPPSALANHLEDAGAVEAPLFEVVDSAKDADAVVYHAYGDSQQLRDDVARANRAGPHACTPVVFYLTTDGDYAPHACHARLVFFAVNASERSGCEVHAVPNQEGAALNGVGVTLGAILRRVRGDSVGGSNGDNAGARNPPASERSLVASFVGSLYTHPLRRKMETMRADDIEITATDWWLRESEQNASSAAEKRQDLARMAFETAADSVFQLTPRGNGPSSMRLIESMVAGALPVMLDDWTRPFGDSMCGFAVRWPVARPAEPRLALLAALLRHLARDRPALRARRDAMARFLSAHHPAWFDTRFVRDRVAGGGSGLCAAATEE